MGSMSSANTQRETKQRVGRNTWNMPIDYRSAPAKEKSKYQRT